MIEKISLKWISIAFTAFLLTNNYDTDRVERERAKRNPYKTVFSPDSTYKIKIYYISFGEPIVLLFRVFDKNDVLIAEHTRETWPGATTENWICAAGPCTEYIFAIGEAESIRLPPTWLDRLRAKIP